MIVSSEYITSVGLPSIFVFYYEDLLTYKNLQKYVTKYVHIHVHVHMYNTKYNKIRWLHDVKRLHLA